MKIWRVANAKYRELNGIGGLKYSGRWHTAGKPIVYTADHPALAAMEVLVHMDMDFEDLPDYVLLEITVPDDILVLEDSAKPEDAIACQQVGDTWLAEGASAILQVQSVLTPSASNYLINPLHPKMSKICITHEEPFNFDERLFK